MQPQSEKNRKTDRNPKSRKARRRQKEQQMKFLRQNSWLILLAVLVLVALILFGGLILGVGFSPASVYAAMVNGALGRSLPRRRRRAVMKRHISAPTTRA